MNQLLGFSHSTLFSIISAVVQQDAGSSSSAAASYGVSSIADIGLNPFRLIAEHMHRLDFLNHPNELLDTLAQLHIVWAGIFVIVGLLSVINGYKWHKWMVMLVALMAGMGLGFALSKSMQANLVVAACLGVLTAVVAWPFMKFAIAACGGLAGAVVGANVWSAANLPPDMHFAGAVMGLIVFGLMSFILYRVVIVAMTCVAGSIIFVMGALAFMLQVDTWQTSLRTDFNNNPIVLPLIVLVVAVVGFVLQHEVFALDKSTSAAGAKSGGASHGKAAVA